MLSPRNATVLHRLKYRNTVLLQSSSSRTHKYYIGFCPPPGNTTDSQIGDRGLGLTPFKIQEVQSKYNNKRTQSYTTNISVIQVASIGFVNKPLLDLFLYQEPSNGTQDLHIGLRWHSFTNHVFKYNEINL
jgi:hypothetical protein